MRPYSIRRRASAVPFALTSLTAALLPLAAGAVPALLAPAAARAQAPAAAPDRVAKVRVRVYLHEIRSLGHNSETSVNNLRSEIYLSAAFQGGTETPYYTLVPPASVEEGRPSSPSVWRYQTPYTLLDAAVVPGGKVRGGFSAQEDDGDYEWREPGVRQTVQGSIDRAVREIGRSGANAYLTPNDLRTVALKAMPLGGTGAEGPVGTPLSNDDRLKDFALEYPVDGPASEDVILDAREVDAKRPWHYQFVLRIQRQPLREDGTPILPPAPAPAPSNPDTGDVVGGNFRMIGGSGFAARVDRVRYGAPVQDDTVRVTVTYRNTSAFAQALRPGMLAAGLALDGRPEREAAGPALQWPGPANAPAGAVPPGETVAPDGLTTVVYTFKVGDAAEQERAARLRVREARPDAPLAEFPLPAFRRPEAPEPAAEPSSEDVRGLRRLAGRYRTSLGTVVTVRADGKFLSAKGVTEETAGSAVPRQAESWSLALQPGGLMTVKGLWTDYTKVPDQATHRGIATVLFDRDGKGFQGRVVPSTFGVPAFEYSGVRIDDGAPPTDTSGGGAGWVTVGKQTPAGFRLRSLEYHTASVNIGDQTISPKADQKLLVVRFTLRNDHSRRYNFEFATARVSAVDAAGVAYPMVPRIGREGTGESVYAPVEPGGTMEVYAAIVMPADAEPVKLNVQGDLRDARDLDIRDLLPAAPRTDDGGAARVGEWCQGGRIDLKLEGVQRTPSYLYATISVRNRQATRLTVDHGVVNVTVIDADGAVTPWDQRMYRTTSTATVPGLVLEPGGEARFRVRYPINADAPAPRSLSLRDGRDGRPFTFALDAAPRP